MAVTNKVLANSFSSFNATLLDVDYLLCNAGIPQPAFALRFVNTSDQNIKISYDGTTDHDLIPAHDFVEIYFQLNNRGNSHIALFPRNTPVYVAFETGPAKGGYLYVISYYQPIM